MLAEYNKAYPSCAEEIVDMARRQSTHRQSVERTVIEGDVKRANRGQILGFIVAMTIVLGGVALLWQGKSITGLITLVGGMTGLVGIFVYARRRGPRPVGAELPLRTHSGQCVTTTHEREAGAPSRPYLAAS